MKHSFPLLLSILLCVSCSETYVCEELSFDPNIVYSQEMEYNRTIDVLHSFSIKAKDDNEAKQKAEELFQSRIKALPPKDFKSGIVYGYSLRIGDYGGREVERKEVSPGVEHNNVKKEKAFDKTNFGDNRSKIKGYYQVVEQRSKENYSVSNEGTIRKSYSFGGIPLKDNAQPNYSLETNTLSTKIRIMNYDFTASFVFWQDRLFKVQLISDDSFRTINEASNAYLQIRNLIFQANGFPSWIDKIRDESYNTWNRQSMDRPLSNWLFSDSFYTLGLVYVKDMYRVEYCATSSTISNEMSSIVERTAKEAINKKSVKEKTMAEEAINLF